MTDAQILSPLDAAFLHIESGRSPMHIASIGLFEEGPLEDEHGEIRADDIRRLVSSRLSLIPKLRQRPQPGFLGQAPPRWRDDPEFEIANHILFRRLPPPGSERELLSVCGEILAAPIDRSRSMWDMTFVTGLEDGMVAVVQRLHHSMADGIAAAELAVVLLDPSPETSAAESNAAWRPEPRANCVEGAVADVAELARIAWRVPSWVVSGMSHPVRRTRSLASFGQSVGSLLHTGLIAPKSPLNTSIGEARAVRFVRMDIGEVKQVAHENSATVNDVLLTIVTGGLRVLLAGDDGETDFEEQRALCPVGLDTGDGRPMTNRVSAVFVTLPLGIDDPREALAFIASDTAALKHSHQELAGDAGLHLLDPLPQSALAWVVRLVRHQPFFNLIVTNVPGPTSPLYLLGAEMVEAFPIVPLIGNQGLGIAALSYRGNFNLGILSDPEHVSDVDAFCEGCRDTLALLRKPSSRAIGRPPRPVSPERGGRGPEEPTDRQTRPGGRKDGRGRGAGP
jgi:diacylglycerol O-acyltransferase / wax synthase